MKKNSFSQRFFPLLMIGIILIFVYSCKKKDDNNSDNNTTNSGVPVLTTTVISGVTLTSAISGGTVTGDGGATVTARGVCWSTSQNPTTADNKTTDSAGSGSYTSSISGLNSNTTYYVRAYATNSVGTGYGSQMVLKTFTGTVTDKDGNVYYTITIGTQVWMASNLKVTHYTDSSPILPVTSASEWDTLTSGAYCYYNNTSSNSNTYGLLYNYYAAAGGKLSPAGWHVASFLEWETLVDTLGGNGLAGGALKESGILHWTTPNSGDSNSSGFTALPGGFRSNTGAYSEIQNKGYFWTTTSLNSTNAYYFGLWYDNASVEQNNCLENQGLSVRCVMN